jgi:hypothetical protein
MLEYIYDRLPPPPPPTTVMWHFTEVLHLASQFQFLKAIDNMF